MSDFNFLRYLASHRNDNGEDQTRIPPLTELSAIHGVSIASLREQLGVARALGFVDVRPRVGIRRLPYSFAPAVSESLAYAMACDRKYFAYFSDMRRRIEAAYWHEAVAQLGEAEHAYLHKLVEQAWSQLHTEPIRVPHQEHRDLHLAIFSKLDNPFVTGILEAYWNAYEEVGLNLFTELDYLRNVWQYHRQIVEAICAGNLESSYTAMLDHMDLIDRRNGAIE